MSYSNIYPQASRMIMRMCTKLTAFGIINKGHGLRGAILIENDDWKACQNTIGRDETAKRIIEKKAKNAMWLKSYHMLPQHFWCKAEAILVDSDVRIVGKDKVRLGIDFMCEELDVAKINNMLGKSLIGKAITMRYRIEQIKKRYIKSNN